MKIAILTFHRALNYGAVLQAYALQKKVKEFNCDTQILNYKCEYLEKIYSPFYIQRKSIKKFLYMLCAIGVVCKKRHIFSDFLKKYCILSDKKYTYQNIKEADKEYDCFIVGSDQVWNYQLTNCDEIFFLNFAEKARRASYAASFGFSYIDTDYRERCRELLEKFDYLSVREKSGKMILKDLVDKDVMCVPDPVFLLSAEEWKKMAQITTHKPYILVYKLLNPRVYDYAEALAKKTGKTIVEIQAPIKQFRKFEKYRVVTVEQFLGWVLGADYIVTDSFHATAFSIIFNKTPKVILGAGKNNSNSRLTDMLQMFNLKDLIVNSEITVDKVDEQEFTFVNEELIKQRQIAEAYLRTITQG